MKTERDRQVNAGRSAVVGYRESRARQRRARARVAGLFLVSAPLVVAGLVNGAAWLVALGIAGCLWAFLTWPRDDPARWLRGSAGERATAALLAELPRRGWVVLHDRAVPDSRANIDHLVIGSSGVWIVDTKTYRAPLSIRRGRVWAGDYVVPTDAAAWEAEQVADLLDTEVTAVVAVHGVGLRRRGKRCHGVLIVPADRLRRRLRRPGRRRRLTRAQIRDLGRRASEALPEYR